MKSSIETKQRVRHKALETTLQRLSRESTRERPQDAKHDLSGKIGQGQTGLDDQGPGLATEFFSKMTGLNQDVELNKTEEELLEDLNVLKQARARR
jgi:hypothetical protein